MPEKRLTSAVLKSLREQFGDQLQENVSMADFTTARIGGKVDAMLIVHSAADLERAVLSLWTMNLPFHLLGSGSNVLVNDAGIRGVVVLNQARTVKIDVHHTSPTVWAETGANLGGIARQAALRGLGGLEWAASIPGTVGGAVYGNAGANASEMKDNLTVAEILHRQNGRSSWTPARLEFDYRSSWLKRHPGQAVLLSVVLALTVSTPQEVQARIDEFNDRRRGSQPPGASMGSMFKNPPGDFAGRLIDAVGLKGTIVGGAMISPLHGNFFINSSGAKAADVMSLIKLVRQKVKKQLGVELELEIELLGEW